jgi:hypothetical protein
MTEISCFCKIPEEAANAEKDGMDLVIRRINIFFLLLSAGGMHFAGC